MIGRGCCLGTIRMLSNISACKHHAWCASVLCECGVEEGNKVVSCRCTLVRLFLGASSLPQVSRQLCLNALPVGFAATDQAGHHSIREWPPPTPQYRFGSVCCPSSAFHLFARMSSCPTPCRTHARVCVVRYCPITSPVSCSR